MTRKPQTSAYLVVNDGEAHNEHASYNTSLGDRTAFDYARQNAQRYGGTIYARDMNGDLHFSHAYTDRSRFPR